MAAEMVKEMTVEELKTLVNQLIDQRMGAQVSDGRTLDEIIESIGRNRWTPPPGSPSTLELLREDRDR